MGFGTSSRLLIDADLACKERPEPSMKLSVASGAAAPRGTSGPPAVSSAAPPSALVGGTMAMSSRHSIAAAAAAATTFLLSLVCVACASHLPRQAWGEPGLGNGVDITVDAGASGRRIPHTLFGIFFEEINHAGMGGLCAELVQNRGFEAGGPNTPSSIEPWFPVGTEAQVWLETERCSPFVRNPVALRMEIRCEEYETPCSHGVGVKNLGYWGMNVEEGEEYRVIIWLRSADEVDLRIAFVSAADEQDTIAATHLRLAEQLAFRWRKEEVFLRPNRSDHAAHLAITTTKKGVIWLDQISATPVRTFKGHGMRLDLANLLADLKPGFVRFPGGCYVEGDRLADAFRWRQSVGPWEERPGHFNGVWQYWSDDQLGLFEYLQFCEDLGAVPVWVFNNGISHSQQVFYPILGPFIKDILDGVEFARGPASSRWGSLRADMGHPEPFHLHHIAIGNEDCGAWNYRGSYLRFYTAIKAKYPDIKLISNCDATYSPLDHPADLFDYHIYTSAANLFEGRTFFDKVDRKGPKVFVSEYAVVGTDAGKGSLLGAVAEAAYMMGLEQNSDIVAMASYAPLLVNDHDRRWNPDAIVFNSYKAYGTPSYYVQKLFRTSNSAVLLPATMEADPGAAPVTAASVVRFYCSLRDRHFLLLKVVNIGKETVQVRLRVKGLEDALVDPDATITVLRGESATDENSFLEPRKVALRRRAVHNSSEDMLLDVHPMSVTSLELGTISDSRAYLVKASKATAGLVAAETV
eukprot:SM000006S19351  [mRNA]  locus=s6:258455:264282:- [translate_table: standard]